MSDPQHPQLCLHWMKLGALTHMEAVSSQACFLGMAESQLYKHFQNQDL